jgi:glutathione S-transferase
MDGYRRARARLAGRNGMKLYIDAGRAPNPRRVRIFLAEKGLSLPTEAVDIGSQAHKAPAFRAVNPMARLPALVLDDGTTIAESIAICRYVEALHPAPPLFGEGALAQALVEMWQRRVELHLLGLVSSVFRHLHPAMAALEVPQVAAWGEANKPRVMEFLAFLDDELKTREYVAGAAFSVADITAVVAVDFMKPAKLAVPEGLGPPERRRGAVGLRQVLSLWRARHGRPIMRRNRPLVIDGLSASAVIQGRGFGVPECGMP